jgi:hypothetical protein
MLNEPDHNIVPPTSTTTESVQELSTSWDEQDEMALMRWEDDGGAPRANLPVNVREP